MIVYFSGTGNSRYCAKMLADKLEDELLDTFHFIRDGIALELTSTKPWIFVSPNYSWRIPKVFEAALRSGFFSGSRDEMCIRDRARVPLWSERWTLPPKS